MSVDLTLRLREIGAVLADRLPIVLDAASTVLESILPALEAARTERYEIGPQIGAGGMAEVFLGTVRGGDGFQRPVAIKRVRSDRADAGRFVAMLINEAQLASRLAHPNVVSVLDFDRDPAGPFLVMDYVAGVDLAKLIETEPVPYPVAIFIVRELLAGLGTSTSSGAAVACAGWSTAMSRPRMCCCPGSGRSSSPTSAWPGCSRGP